MKKGHDRLLLNAEELRQLETTADLLHRIQRTLAQDCEINHAAWLARRAIETILLRDEPNVIPLDPVWHSWRPHWHDT